MAQKIAIAYVNKKRLEDHNILEQAGASKPVEVGAVWSDPDLPGAEGQPLARIHSGHFFIDPGPQAAAPKAVAGATFPLPAWLSASLLRFKQDLPQELQP
jgi:hypothetical protein